MIQLDFFQDDDMLRLENEVNRLRESNDKVRKSLFAKNGELTKTVLNLVERLEILERNICKGER